MADHSRKAFAERVEVLATLVRSGVLRPDRPDRTVRQLSTLRRWGPTLAAGYAVAAIRNPTGTAVIDDTRIVTFGQLDDRATRLARGLTTLGAEPASRVALMCRNHALLVEAMVACSRLGVDAVLINTGLSAAQTTAVIKEHDVIAVIADEEFAPSLVDVPGHVHHITAAADGRVTGPTMDDLIEIESRPARSLPAPSRPGRIIVLTSGTTGVPKGARRPNPPGLGAAASVLSRIPLRAGEQILVPAPLFHTWGLAALQIGMSLRAGLIMQRRFDPEATLAAIQRYRATALFAVPVMLTRILELPASVRASYDTSTLRIAASSGSALPAACVTGFLDAFGDILYNLYGSTEVSWASIAGPAELRADPASAGRPPLGTQVVILDHEGAPLPAGRVGRIFVGNDMLFDGYTGGVAGKEVRDGLMATGDRGHLDRSGQLFVAGRDDDMIVSGGENVFPREVEDVLATLPGVAEVAVAGVPDDTFGQRFAAYVVPRPGIELTADAVRDHVRGRLAKYSVPRDVIFLDELPRNATGKVILSALRELHP